MDSPKISNWVLTPHAAERAMDRNISMQEISEVLKTPDIVKKQGPKYILAKKFTTRIDNHIACVVLEKKSDNLWVVITVMHNFEEH